jgi:hypothetical protein
VLASRQGVSRDKCGMVSRCTTVCRGAKLQMDSSVASFAASDAARSMVWF